MIPSDKATSDIELWRSLQQGSEKALTELMKIYIKPLTYYGQKMLKDNDQIQDCIQETFIQLWLYRSGLKDLSQVRPYLLTCLRRKIIRALKQEQNLGELDLDTPFYIDFSIEESLIESETEALRVKRMNALINKLPRRQKEAIYLRFFENMDNKEIAEVMGIKYQTARNILHEALDTLRQLMPDSMPVFTLTMIGWASKIL